MDQNIISGPNIEFSIKFESFGKFMFDLLKKRDANETIAINPLTKESLTCGEVLDKSVRLAKVLKKLSVEKGDIIVLSSENNFNCYVVTCATLFCGAILYPLNFAYSPGELKHAVELSKPKIIFSTETGIKTFLTMKEEIDCIEKIISIDSADANEVQSIQQLIDSVQYDEDFKPVVGDSTDTVFLCLSSGTTGLPKCVELSHQSLIPLMNYSYDPDYLDFIPKDTTVLVMPFFHIFGLTIHLLAITNSVIVIQIKSFKPDLFLEAIEEYKATKLCVVPTLLQFLVRSSMTSKYNFKNLQNIIVGGGMLTIEMHEEALHKFSHCSIRQLYGSTETVGACTAQPRSSKSPCLGKVTYNTTIKVVDVETKAILGPYESGEICVKIPSIMKGYRNNPIETKRSFDSDGFYCTGDIGYYDKEKMFFMVGRLKELIKYKSFQVPPEELENLLANCPGVKDCGVVGLKDERCGQLPLAFVVRQEGSEVTAEEIIKYVADNISVQKQLHGGVRFIEEIPRTSSGKIARKQLLNLLSNNI